MLNWEFPSIKINVANLQIIIYLCNKFRSLLVVIKSGLKILLYSSEKIVEAYIIENFTCKKQVPLDEISFELIYFMTFRDKISIRVSVIKI